MRFLVLCLIPILQISSFTCHLASRQEQHRRHQRTPYALSDLSYVPLPSQSLSSSASLLADSGEFNPVSSDEGSEVETLGAFSLASKPFLNLTPLLQAAMAGQGALYHKRSGANGGSSSLHDLSIVAPLNVLRKSKQATENMRNLLRQQNQIRENERILADKGKRASYANFLE